MRRAILVMLFAVGVTGCAERDAKNAVAATLRNPGAAKFANVRTNDRGVCGQVNGLDASGVAIGYRAFVYDARTAVVHLAPPFKTVASDQRRAVEACQSIKALQAIERFSGVSTVLSDRSGEVAGNCAAARVVIAQGQAIGAFERAQDAICR